MESAARVLAPILTRYFTPKSDSQTREEELYRFFLPFYEEMAQDLLIGFFFEGKDLRKIARNQAQLVHRASGLSTHYAGKLPGAAHLGIAPILSGHFDRRLRILEAHLRKRGLQEPEVQAWISFENSFRAAIQAR